MNPNPNHDIDPESVLAYGENFILYYDQNDRNHLLLEIDDIDSGPSLMRIPIDVWQVIHQCGTKILPFASISDDLLRDMSLGMVAARKEIRHSADLMPNWKLNHLGGFEAFGSEEDPEEQQVQFGIAAYKRLRDWEQAIHERARRHRIVRTVSSVQFPSLSGG
jgi:hypothetical protein